MKGHQEYVDKRCPDTCLNRYGWKRLPDEVGTVSSETEMMNKRFTTSSGTFGTRTWKVRK